MIIEEYNNSRKSDISTIDKFIKLCKRKDFCIYYSIL